jgi:hypothetical protein
MTDAGNGGNGGQRKSLPAFFALTSVVAVAFVIVAAIPRGSDSDTAVTRAAAPMPAASVEPSVQVTAHDLRERHENQVLEIERALVSTDVQQRERALNVLLPELLDSEPARVIDLVARQEGETRDVLRDEVVRLWIRKDRVAALVWMGSMESEAERKASATMAMRTLAAIEPAQAIAVADEFGIGRDDGSLEHIVQIWAAENFDECLKWLETQPDNAQTAQLRARIVASR